MATLHVRNVPDELYEALRERAATNDRSIGAETTQLLSERLLSEQLGRSGFVGAQPLQPPLRRRPGKPGGRFTRFTAAARESVVSAQVLARELNHQQVGTSHLLVGVLEAATDSPLADELAELGLTPERARRELSRVQRKGGKPSPGRIPFDPEAKEALEIALREALKLGCDAIDPAHVLLGILGRESGKGAAIVRAVEPDAGKVRRRAAAAAALPPGPAMRLRPRPSFRVLLLEGDPETWERSLNEAAALGYDLVEIVDGRAILRRV